MAVGEAPSRLPSLHYYSLMDNSRSDSRRVGRCRLLGWLLFLLPAVWFGLLGAARSCGQERYVNVRPGSRSGMSLIQRLFTEYVPWTARGNLNGQFLTLVFVNSLDGFYVVPAGSLMPLITTEPDLQFNLAGTSPGPLRLTATDLHKVERLSEALVPAFTSQGNAHTLQKSQGSMFSPSFDLALCRLDAATAGRMYQTPADFAIIAVNDGEVSLLVHSSVAP
jgi:hypothetical protein